MLLKIKHLQKLQNLQDAYSSLCGLLIMITDLLEGQRIPIDDTIVRIIDKVKDL